MAQTGHIRKKERKRTSQDAAVARENQITNL